MVFVKFCIDKYKYEYWIIKINTNYKCQMGKYVKSYVGITIIYKR